MPVEVLTKPNEFKRSPKDGGSGDVHQNGDPQNSEQKEWKKRGGNEPTLANDKLKLRIDKYKREQAVILS